MKLFEIEIANEKTHTHIKNVCCCLFFLLLLRVEERERDLLIRMNENKNYFIYTLSSLSRNSREL